MATTYLVSGSVTVAAAGWADGIGFAAACQLIIPDGGQTITTSLDQSAAAAGKFLRIEPPFKGFIGSTSVPLICRMSDGSSAQKTSANTEGYVYYGAESGELNLKADATTGIDNFFMDSGGVCNLVGGAGTFRYVHLTNGGLNILGPAVVANFEAYGGSSTMLEASSTCPGSVDIWAGYHTIKRQVNDGGGNGTLDIYGGTVVLDVESSTATLVVNLWGGTLIHVAGNITAMNHYAGHHDATRLRKEATITTCIRRPNAKFSGVRSSGLLTVSTDTTIGFPKITQ